MLLGLVRRDFIGALLPPVRGMAIPPRLAQIDSPLRPWRAPVACAAASQHLQRLTRRRNAKGIKDYAKYYFAATTP